MICKYCLTKIDDDSVFCESCGSRVQETGNNEETQLLPKVEEKVVPSRSAAFAANGGRPPVQEAAAAPAAAEGANTGKKTEKDIRVSDISKLLAEIYDEEDEDDVPEQEPLYAAAETPELDRIQPAFKVETELEEEPDPVKETIPEEEKTETALPPQDAELPLYPELPETTGPMFCMACGRKLPEGAAFCDMCGTATGAVEPSEIRRRKAKNSVALPILKGYFSKPADMIEKAVSEEAFSLGAGVLIIKDLLAAVIAAFCMGQMAAVLEGSWLLSGDAFGFAAKVFLLAVLADIILLGLVFGIGVLFKAGGTIKEITAVCGTGYLLPGIIWLIALLLQAFAPAAGMCVSLIAFAVTVLYIGKAIDSVGRISKNKSIYMVIAVIVIYTAIIYGGLTWMIA